MNLQWIAFDTAPFLQIQLAPAGYIIVAAYAALTIVFFVRNLRDFGAFTTQRWLYLVGGCVAGSLLAGVLILHMALIDPRLTFTLPLLVLLPLVVTAMWLGAAPAMLVGLLTGLTHALFVTHRATTPFEYALLGAILALLLTQRYQGRFAHWLRQPLTAVMLGAVLVGWPLGLVGIFATGQDTAVANLELTSTLILPTFLYHLFTALIAGGLLQVVLLRQPELHPLHTAELETPPWSRHLSRRISYSFIPAAFIFIFLLVSVVTITANRASTRLVLDQMSREAATAASQTLFFSQMGRGLIRNLAGDDSLSTADEAELTNLLEEDVTTVPFFQQIMYIDIGGQVFGASPSNAPLPADLSPVEQERLRFVIEENVPAETTIYLGAGSAVWMSFMSPVSERDTGDTIGVLIGRTSLSENQTLEPVADVLQTGFVGIGEGLLVDSNDQAILYPAHPERRQQPVGLDNLRPVTGRSENAFIQWENDGTRQLVYLAPVMGRSDWTVVILAPHEIVLALALQIALPTLLVLVVLATLMLPLILTVTRSISDPLEELSGAADAIAEGRMSQPLTVTGEDELGRLGRAFEQMRVRLNHRLSEQDRLLNISRSVSSSLELFRAMPPILSSALDITGAAGVRIALRRSEGQPYQTYAAGETAAAMAVLDQQLVDLVERQGTVVISQLWRASGSLDTSNLLERIKALAAFPLRSDTQFHGILWLGFDEEHPFEQSEMTFLSTLAGQAAIAVSNSRLFAEAEEGRRKLEAVLSSTADGMIVVDTDGRVTLLNPSAEEYFDARTEHALGKRASDIVQVPELAEVLTDLQEPVSALEIPYGDGRTLLANTSTIVGADGAITGRVAVLRDITALKELDNIKTVFLRMVSHDLRSPLTYMRGYASMLPLNGPLNERQQDDLEKIIDGIENIKQMTERLTYLSRLQFGEEAELELVPVDVVQTLQEAAGQHLPLAEQKDIALSIEVEEGLPLLMVDAMLYGQAVNNLVQNALKYTPESGEVTLRATHAEPAVTENDETVQQVTVSVIDTGMGIRREDQPRLFEAFYRVPQRDGDPPRPKGTGIGLALVKAIVQAHGGSVGVDSEWGEGATFTITVPVRSVDEL